MTTSRRALLLGAGSVAVLAACAKTRSTTGPPPVVPEPVTTAGLHPGAVISLHTGHPGTVAAFAPIVTAIAAAGLRPVLLSDLPPVSGSAQPR